MSVFFIGAGKAGRTLAALLQDAGLSVIGAYDIDIKALENLEKNCAIKACRSLDTSPIKTADIVMVAVNDDEIPKVGAELIEKRLINKGQIIAHLSGCTPASALGLGSDYNEAVFHPLLSLADSRLAEEAIKTAYIGISGNKSARKILGELAKKLGATPVLIDGNSQALYHAAAAIAANLPAALLILAQQLFKTAGIEPEAASGAAASLMKSCADNLCENGLPAGLTGALSRGDTATVKKHIDAIRHSCKESPAVLKTYSLLSEIILNKLENENTLDTEAIQNIKKSLSTAE